MSSQRKDYTPLIPPAKQGQTTTEQDFSDYLLYLDGQMNWEPRFAKFQPKAQRDCLEAYLMTNGL